ncbi:MAG: hypothetical protein MUF04_02285 [Akkermansiaceae bacterium]|jgi:hypothetical protein|nr:hypothetical protein [Akkermansiaceae bacterium]
MSMTFRHLILGLSSLVALHSCTGDRYYDTPPYGQYGRPQGQAGRAPSAYGGQAAPYGTQQAPYGTQPGSAYGGTPQGHSPYAPGAPSAGPGALGTTTPTAPALPPPTSPAAAAKTYPVARPSGKPGIVVSPYDPNKLIDVSGFPSGKRVKDRDTGEIFIVP